MDFGHARQLPVNARVRTSWTLEHALQKCITVHTGHVGVNGIDRESTEYKKC